ncbi:hypothetical protein B0A55_06351 [Friedmanniomyces simplex]|uniref:HMG box domain-containing protein n=1 Tax=Friedmanniomyces simplex TaxID=329884 RepID=A0A4U0XH77_9PEZI|nr:hypothetical protein B0A55_06351 [Friedmanniomyces simplex]
MAGPSPSPFHFSTSEVDQTSAPSPADFDYLSGEDFTNSVAGNDSNFDIDTTSAPVDFYQNGDTINPMIAFTPAEFGQSDGNLNALTASTPAESTQTGDIIYAPQPQYYALPQEAQGPYYSLPLRPQSVIPIQPVPAPPAGAHYNPAVGWYYPLQPQSMPVQVPAPAQLVSTFSPYPMTDKHVHSGKRKQRRDSLDLSGDEDKQRPSKRKNTPRTGALNLRTGRKNPSIAQNCVCGTAKQHIPRPRNAFILYRQAMTKDIAKSAEVRSRGDPHKINHKLVSSEAGSRWNNESKAVRARFQQLARQEVADHARKYPDYRYQPGRKNEGPRDSRFGTAECRCGAYAANVLRMRDAGIEMDADVLDDEADAPCEEVAEFAYPAPMACPAPTAYPAPIAQMIQPAPQPIATPTLRRSSRPHNTALSYAAPSDDDLFDNLFTSSTASTVTPQPTGDEESAITTPYTSAPPSVHSRERYDLSTVPEDGEVDFDMLFNEAQDPLFDYAQFLDLGSSSSGKRKQRRDSLDLSDDEDKQRPSKRKTARRTGAPNPRTARKNPSIAQNCVCGTAKQHIPRPRNAFILYRQAMTKDIAKSAEVRSRGDPHKINHKLVSSEAGLRWNNESKAVRARFQQLARQEVADHARKYPNYRYQPGRKNEGPRDSRFGTAECRCGAYVANVLRMRDAGIELDADVLDDEADAPCEEVAGFAYPAPMAYPAPIAQMIQPAPQPIATPTLRRSSRAHNTAISYAEPSDDEVFDNLFTSSTASIAPPHFTGGTESGIISPYTSSNPSAHSRERYDLSTVPEDGEVDFDMLFNEAQDPSFDYAQFLDLGSSSSSGSVGGEGAAGASSPSSSAISRRKSSAWGVGKASSPPTSASKAGGSVSTARRSSRRSR